MKLPEDKETRCGYGILSTGPNDPMLKACAKHDERFDAHAKGDNSITLNEANVEFEDDMLTIALAERGFWSKTGLIWQTAVYGTIVGLVSYIFW